ncbi:hypothetical protein B0H63DRAFT_511853 [Podospora didyma]|uniref:Uncharacterized protein n=1 Tax=Podospora didyma TaxID=330526 RepID=A0AAE0NBV2_9PEZI|nr:hypothetical protein B0H63DRAFT_511853 [Podospora didyma]
MTGDEATMPLLAFDFIVDPFDGIQYTPEELQADTPIQSLRAVTNIKEAGEPGPLKVCQVNAEELQRMRAMARLLRRQQIYLGPLVDVLPKTGQSDSFAPIVVQLQARKLSRAPWRASNWPLGPTAAEREDKRLEAEEAILGAVVLGQRDLWMGDGDGEGRTLDVVRFPSQEKTLLAQDLNVYSRQEWEEYWFCYCTQLVLDPLLQKYHFNKDVKPELDDPEPAQLLAKAVPNNFVEWTVVDDNSITELNVSEYVTIFILETLFRELDEICYVNLSTGGSMHVHLSPTTTKEDMLFTTKQMAKIVKATAYFDNAITASVSHIRKLNPWCYSSFTRQKAMEKAIGAKDQWQYQLMLKHAETTSKGWDPVFSAIDQKIRRDLDKYLVFGFLGVIGMCRPPGVNTESAASGWAAFALGFMAATLWTDNWVSVGTEYATNTHPRIPKLRAFIRSGLEFLGDHHKMAKAFDIPKAYPTFEGEFTKEEIKDITKKENRTKKRVLQKRSPGRAKQAFVALPRPDLHTSSPIKGGPSDKAQHPNPSPQARNRHPALLPQARILSSPPLALSCQATSRGVLKLNHRLLVPPVPKPTNSSSAASYYCEPCYHRPFNGKTSHTQLLEWDYW